MPSQRTSPKRATKTGKPQAPATAVAQGLKRPRLWIVAGPNGSGKSVLYGNTDIEDFGRSVWIINPDLLSARIRETEALSANAANLEAVKRIEDWLKASVRAYQSIGVETVLSTPKYRALVTAAKKQGFEFNLIYVLLKSVELNIERVAIRVRNGGHDVPRQKIIDRRARSLKELPWFVAQADRALVFDNSGARPLLIAEKTGRTIYLDKDALPEVREIVNGLGSSRRSS